jgi:hypothetical protein
MPDICLIEAQGPDEPPYTYLPEELLSVASVLNDVDLDVSVFYGRQDLPKCGTLVVSASMEQYRSALGIAKQRRGMRTFLCGDYITAATVDAMCQPLFEVGVIGDPEIPILELVTGKKPRSVKGAVYWHRGTLVVNPKVDLLKFPPLAYHAWRGPWGESANISKVREYTLKGDRWKTRGRSGLKNYLVFDKQVSQLRKCGVKHAVLTDSDFSGASKEIKGTIRSLNRFDSWECRATTKTVLANRLYKSLEDSRCRGFTLIANTASDRLAQEIGSATRGEHELALSLLSKSVEKLRVEVTVGYPGETVVSMNETRDWLRRCIVRDIPTYVRTYRSLPGMDSYEEPHKFDRFGFEVVGVDCDDFWIDDSQPIFNLPWRSATISLQDFLGYRNKMVEEFNGG